jgi:hypothetical protein
VLTLAHITVFIRLVEGSGRFLRPVAPQAVYAYHKGSRREMDETDGHCD